jgi:predicted amino acid dehydrogenase
MKLSALFTETTMIQISKRKTEPSLGRQLCRSFMVSEILVIKVQV